MFILDVPTEKDVKGYKAKDPCPFEGLIRSRKIL